MQDKLFGKEGFVQFHTAICVLLFLMYIPITVSVLIEHGLPKNGIEFGLVAWGFIAGLSPNLFWGVIIREQRKRIQMEGK